MRYLISILLIVGLASCSLKTTEGLRSATIDTAVVENNYFSNAGLDYVYKAKLDIYGNYFGGILIIKKMGADSHRVVFTTEFGNKLFDFLYEGDTFTKNYVVEDLDRKLIINTLKRDFQILLKERSKVIEQWEGNQETIYKTEFDNRYNYYKFSSENKQLKEIVHTSAVKEKINLIFTSVDKVTAQTIQMNHQNIKLTIALEKFEN